MPTMPSQKKIFIVDDHPVLRRGLSALIASDPDLVVAGEADTSQAAIEALPETQPDLVIVDLVLNGSDGLDLIKAIGALHPAIATLVLSMHDEATYAMRSLRAGAKGYVNKQRLDDTVLIAIHKILAGETYVSAQVEAQFAARYIGGRTLDTDGPVEALTDRQLQVFRLIGQGQTTRQIAETLSLSIKTIESHREHIKDKLTIETSAELARRAVQWFDADQNR
jgi:DNA-binding NarL/FixJ family response regulator